MISRRSLLRLGIETTLGITAATARVGTLVTGISLMSYFAEENKVKEPLANPQIAPKNPPQQYVIRVKHNNLDIKLHGVEHSYRFAQKNYYAMDELVSHADVVVPEYAVTTPDERKGYFGTIEELCKKHNKPMVGINPQTTAAVYGELIVGTVAGLSAFRLLKNISTADRRTFLKKSAATSACIYAWLSSIASMYPKSFFWMGSKHLEVTEVAFFNHIIDQRNVAYADRLLQLPKYLPELAQGGKILFTSGRGHTAGIAYYLNHPRVLQFKKEIYKETLDKITRRQIMIARPHNNVWKLEMHEI